MHVDTAITSCKSSRRFLDTLLFCGIALSYENTQALENALITERESAKNFTPIHDI